jgi:hypothetical protein
MGCMWRPASSVRVADMFRASLIASRRFLGAVFILSMVVCWKNTHAALCVLLSRRGQRRFSPWFQEHVYLIMRAGFCFLSGDSCPPGASSALPLLALNDRKELI